MNGPQPMTPSQILAARKARRTGDQQKQFAMFNLMGQSERIEFVLEELLQLSLMVQRLAAALDRDVPAIERRIAALEQDLTVLKASLAQANNNTAETVS